MKPLSVWAAHLCTNIDNHDVLFFRHELMIEFFCGKDDFLLRWLRRGLGWSTLWWYDCTRCQYRTSPEWSHDDGGSSVLRTRFRACHCTVHWTTGGLSRPARYALRCRSYLPAKSVSEKVYSVLPYSVSYGNAMKQKPR